MKPLVLFLVAFALSAAVALAVRTARHDPHAVPASAPAPAIAPTTPAADPHAGHTLSTPPAAAKTVNTVCALCGMDVDPSIKPAEYQGKLIGFGCRACPPRFAKDPDRYGPSALRNVVYSE
jgi:hypothetical protein